MQTQTDYYYTYYSYEEYGRGYIGSRKCKCLPEEDVKYFGSSKDKTFKPTQKIILKSDYNTREEAYAEEIILQRYYKVVENSHFANKAYQTSTKFYVPTEQAREYGKISGKKGGKVSGPITKKLGIGIHGQSTEKRKENGIKGGTKTYQLGIGIHSQTKKQLSANGKKGGKIAGNKIKELGLGVHGLSTEERKRNSKLGGDIAFELRLGFHSLTDEQRSENSKKGGKIGGKKVSSQKWQCTETGFITNAGNLARYQRKRGIDTFKRKRIS